MPTAYAYSRYSSAAQSEGDSLRRQLKASFDFAEKHGLDLDTTLQDLGVSGYSGLNRIKGALGSFIRRVESGQIAHGSYLLVDSLDRFSRESETQVLNMLTGLTLKGIKVVNVAEGHILDADADASDFIRVVIHASRSRKESEEKSRKVRLARAEERRLAREHKTPATPIAPHWLKLVDDGKGRKVWQKQPDRVEVIERIFAMKEAGLGNAFICKTLNAEGVKTPKPPRKKAGKPQGTSGKWFNTTVGDIVSSRTVLGEYQPWTTHPLGISRPKDEPKRVPDGPAIVGFYPPIIEEAQFNRVQALVEARKNPNARPAAKAFRNLLIGLCECKSCGGVVGYAASTFPRQPTWKPKGYLRCNAVARGLCNNTTRISTDKLEAELLPFIAGLKLAEPRTNESAMQAVLDAEAERLALRTKIDNLLEGLEKGGKLVAERLAERHAELETLERRIVGLRTVLVQDRDATPIHEVIGEIGQLAAALAGSEGEELYALRARIHAGISQVVKGGFVLDEGFIRVRFKPPRADGKPTFFWGKKDSLIYWETDPAMPDGRITSDTIMLT